MYKGKYTGTLIEDSINSTLINADIPSRVIALEELVRNLQSGSGGGGGNIPSDLYISRLLDDFANGLITFNLGVKIGRFVTGTTGGCFSVDNLGQTSIEVDKLYVRLKAYFETLEIIHTNSVRGRWMITPGGSIKIIKVETNNINSAVPENVYRCYFDVDDGDTAITNPFVENDLIQCKSFNIKPGIYQHVSNKYYWRAVVGVPDTNGNYVDLSMILSDTGSDIPEAGDVICLLGNTTNIDRQSAIVYSTVDTFSPSCSLYLGINDFTFDGKDYISYGVNATTKKAFFNVYGDTFIGNRPDTLGNSTSYIKYTTQNGVELKGKLAVGTTIGNKDLSLKLDELSSSSEDYDAFKQAVLIDLLNILNLVDGAIETWYYEGEPGSTAIPENSWVATDTSNGNNNIRNSHIGDLYYDQLTGKAYRYQYDNTTGFYWRLITDTDIIKALEDARKAQDTADSKRKIFVVTPTNDSTYDVGDLWLNATYPIGTTTTNVEANLYYNETLRAVTAKDANTIFNINHWILASKYTDDTVANEAIRQIGELSTDLSDLGTTVSNFLNEVNTTFKDGIINTLEKATLNTYIKNINTTVSGIEALYTKVYENSLLNEVNELEEIVGDSVEKIALNNAWLAFVAAKLDLLDTITSVISDNIISTIEIDLVNVKFSNFNNKYGVLVAAINAANNYMLGKLSGRIDDTLALIGTFNYLKEVFALKTEIIGGLVLTSVVALRDSSDNITAGINGYYDTIKGDKTAAIWFGGANIDMFDHLKLDGTLDMDNMPTNHARGMDRMDGSGYRANGNLWWDTEGRVHADPLSFFVGETQMGLSSALFLFIPKEGVTNITSLNDVSYVVPLLNFNHLNALDYLQIGSVARFKYNSANNAIYIEKEDGTPVNFYATGGISALGLGSIPTSGGASHLYELEDINLNIPTEGLFLKYDGTSWINADIVMPTLSWNNIVDKPTSFNPSTHAHNISDINNLSNILNTKANIATTLIGYGITDANIVGGVITLGTNSITPLTTHQTLYTLTINRNGTLLDIYKPNADKTININAATSITVPIGLTADTLTTNGNIALSFTSGYSIPTITKQTNWDTAFTNNHNHSNKAVIDGITSTLVNNWNTAYTNNHTHNNRAALDKITLDVDGNIVIDGNLYATGGLSALGNSGSSGGGGGVIQTVFGYSNLGGTYSDTDLTNTFNAYTINSLANRLTNVENGALTSVDWSIINGRPTALSFFANDSGFVTASIVNGYATQSWVTANFNNYSLPTASSSVLGGVKIGTGIYNLSGTISVQYGNTTATACQGNDSRLSDARPASDVYAWAKSSVKPTYSCSEVGALNANGQNTIQSWNNGNGTVYSGAFQIRERDFVYESQYAWEYAPGISFHWANRVACKFGMRYDGQFAVNDVPISLSTHTHSYLPLSGGTLTGTLQSSGSQRLIFRHLDGEATTYAGDLYLNYYNSAPIHVGTNGVYTISADGSNYSGTAAYVNNLSLGNSSAGEHDANNISYNMIGYYTGNGPATTQGATNFDGAIYSQAHSSSWVGQIAQDYRNGRLFVRGKNNGTWSAWLNVLDSSNYTSYTVTKTGGGASGTWGIAISGNAATATKLATARTIAGVSFDGHDNIAIPFANLSSKPTTLAGYGITDALLASNYNASDILTKLKTVDGAGSGLDADLLDGVHYQNILERSYSGSSFLGTATGWFRIGITTFNNGGGQAFILKIIRGYNNTNNEAYTFSISAAYNGGINITQLSGFANTRLIDKIRLDYTNSGNTYIDLHISTSTGGNSYYWTTIGGATSYTSWTAVSDTPTGTAYEFTTVNGVKSDRDMTTNGNFLAAGGVSALSDVRLKSDIQPLMSRGYLNPVSYIKDGKRDIGFIAQEVRDLYPELVYEGTDENKYLSLNYAQITAVLQAQIIELKKEINNLNLKLNNYGIQ